jgi:hypothetical protein
LGTGLRNRPLHLHAVRPGNLEVTIDVLDTPDRVNCPPEPTQRRRCGAAVAVTSAEFSRRAGQPQRGELWYNAPLDKKFNTGTESYSGIPLPYDAIHVQDNNAVTIRDLARQEASPSSLHYEAARQSRLPSRRIGHPTTRFCPPLLGVSGRGPRLGP